MTLSRSLLAGPLLFLLGCVHYTPYTFEQLAERGTHRVFGRMPDQAIEACAAALETLGYRVTVKNAEQGLVKTAPHSIMTSVAGGRGYARVTEDGLAWAIQVEKAGNDVVLYAAPRGFRNGSEFKDEGMWVAEVMDAKFQDLWNEIDSTMGAGGIRVGESYSPPPARN